VRVLGFGVGHFVLRDFAGTRIELADVSGEISCVPVLPSRSATRPCGPSFEPLSGYSLKVSVAGSRRPNLLTLCSVNQSVPSGATAGSCGWAPLLGTSHSRMVTLSLETGEGE
jgi:hypothetical protein